MKKLITTLIILLTSNSFSMDVVKVFDGTSAICENKANTWDYRFQAHLIKSIQTEVVGENLDIKLTSVMLGCEKNEEGYAFVEKKLYDDFSYNVVTQVDENQNAILDTVTASTISAKLVILNDKNYSLISSINLNPATSTLNHVSQTIALKDILSDEELTKYNNGVVVNKTLDLYLLRELNLDSQDTTLKYRQSYGSFRTTLTFSK